MWKAARTRHSPLGTSELLNIVLAAIHCRRAQLEAVWLTKPVWMLSERHEFCSLREGKPITLQASRSAYVYFSRRLRLTEILKIATQMR